MVRKTLGSFPSLMQIIPCRKLIEVATTFWDEARSVLSFVDIEMKPLLKEIGGYVEYMNVLPK